MPTIRMTTQAPLVTVVTAMAGAVVTAVDAGDTLMRREERAGRGREGGEEERIIRKGGVDTEVGATTVATEEKERAVRTSSLRVLH